MAPCASGGSDARDCKSVPGTEEGHMAYRRPHSISGDPVARCAGWEPQKHNMPQHACHTNDTVMTHQPVFSGSDVAGAPSNELESAELKKRRFLSHNPCRRIETQMTRKRHASDTQMARKWHAKDMRMTQEWRTNDTIMAMMH